MPSMGAVLCQVHDASMHVRVHVHNGRSAMPSTTNASASHGEMLSEADSLFRSVRSHRCTIPKGRVGCTNPMLTTANLAIEPSYQIMIHMHGDPSEVLQAASRCSTIHDGRSAMPSTRMRVPRRPECPPCVTEKCRTKCCVLSVAETCHSALILRPLADRVQQQALRHDRHRLCLQDYPNLNPESQTS